LSMYEVRMRAIQQQVAMVISSLREPQRSFHGAIGRARFAGVGGCSAADATVRLDSGSKLLPTRNVLQCAVSKLNLRRTCFVLTATAAMVMPVTIVMSVAVGLSNFMNPRKGMDKRPKKSAPKNARSTTVRVTYIALMLRVMEPSGPWIANDGP